MSASNLCWITMCIWTLCNAYYSVYSVPREMLGIPSVLILIYFPIYVFYTKLHEWIEILALQSAWLCILQEQRPSLHFTNGNIFHYAWTLHAAKKERTTQVICKTLGSNYDCGVTTRDYEISKIHFKVSN